MQLFRLQHIRGLLLSLTLLFASCSFAAAQYGRVISKDGVGIDQKLNSALPLDLVFRNESDRPVALRSYFQSKPVILALVYYRCPSLCSMTLSDMVRSLNKVDLKPKDDYNVVIVSIDPSEKPELAAAKKASYSKMFSRPGFDNGWHFLTGDQTVISKLAAAVGFHYRWDEPTHQFVHAAGIIVATPEGKLSRYFYGIQYSPIDLRLSLIEASAHKIGSPVDYVLLYCCPFDPATGKYTVAIYNIFKLAGGVTLLCLGLLVFFLMRSSKQKAAHSARPKLFIANAPGENVD